MTQKAVREMIDLTYRKKETTLWQRKEKGQKEERTLKSTYKSQIREKSLPLMPQRASLPCIRGFRQ
jgi:hypothetical protein